MKYKLRLIRPDTSIDDMLTIDESNLLNTPSIQRQTKRNVKNSVQVKFPERLFNASNSGDDDPQTCSKCINGISTLSGSYGYQKSNITGDIVTIRFSLPGDYFSNADGFSWVHGSGHSVAPTLSYPRCYVAKNQSASYGDDDYFHTIGYTYTEAQFWKADNEPCVNEWFIDYYNNDGVQSYTTKFEMNTKPNTAYIMEFTGVSGGFACKYPWTSDGELAPYIYGGATDWFYI